MAVNCIDMVGKAKAAAKAMPKSKSKGKGKGQGKDTDKGRREVKGKVKGQVKGQGPDKGQGKVKGKAKCLNRLCGYGCKGGGRTCGLEFVGSEKTMREAIAYRRFLELLASESSSD